MQKKITLFFIFLISSLSMALAQSSVKGKVTDKSGQPLPGVTVRVKGTSTATVSDVNGNYSLAVPPNATLTFSFIGFANQDVAVGGQGVVNATMTESATSLNDVVVVGYGTQKKSVLTGSITRVTTADIADQQVTRVDQALQGRTSGVVVQQSSGAPGAAPSILIRGVTSINNTSPLYVIDGVVVLNGGLDNVNPADIESIEVLKDASAAIYGSRASTGVVLVTTKKGKSGAPQLSYSGYVGFQAPVNKIKLANASQYAMLRNEATLNDFNVDKLTKPGLTYTAPFANPAAYGAGTNWENLIFSNNALIQNHNLNIQGGTDKSTYYVSFGYLNQQGIVLKDFSNYKRYNFAVNTSSKIKKWLTVGESFTYTYVHNQGSFNTNSEFGGPLSSALNLDPITPVLQTNSAIAAGYDPRAIRNAQGTAYAISPYVGNEITNPFAYEQTILGNYGWSHNLLGNAFLEINPIAGLKIRSQINGKQAFYGSESFTPTYYLNSNNSNSNPNEYRASNRNLTWNWDNTIDYSHSFGLNNLDVLVGTSAQQQGAVYLNGTYNNLPVNSYTDASFNYNLPAANRVAGAGEDQPYRVASYFGRVNYDYDQRYLLTGIIRRDGSSRFGSNNIWGTFPSVEAGWVATREKFFPKNTFVDFLKVRGSYGVLGNEQSIGAFGYTSIVSGGHNYVFGPDQYNIGYSTSSPPNPDLKWETIHTTDLGFDAVLFQNFNVTFDVYRKLTKGMLENLALPGYTGYTNQPPANVGNLENKGVELELGYRNSIGAFKYNVNGNISYNHNNISYLGNIVNYDGGSFQGTAYSLQRTTVGEPVNEFFGFRELGVFHSQAEINAYTKNGQLIQPNAHPGDFKWQDTNGDGKIDQADRTFLGNPIPTWTYGINVNANYKSFDLKIFGQGVWGNKVYTGYRRLDLPGANYQVEALNAWTPTNASSNYPRLTDEDPNYNFKNPSNFYLQSGAYFRIKTAQVGYTLPKAWASKVDIQRLRIYVSSNNLATITKYNGLDPEVAGGIDRGVYPQSRSFLLGLDLTL